MWSWYGDDFRITHLMDSPHKGSIIWSIPVSLSTFRRSCSSCEVIVMNRYKPMFQTATAGIMRLVLLTCKNWHISNGFWFSSSISSLVGWLAVRLVERSEWCRATGYIIPCLLFIFGIVIVPTMNRDPIGLVTPFFTSMPSHKRHIVSNHWEIDYVFNRFFMRTTTESSKVRITCTLWGESTGDWWIPITKGQ